MEPQCKKCGKSYGKHFDAPKIMHDFKSRTDGEEKAFDEGLKMGIDIGRKKGVKEFKDKFQELIGCQNTCNC